MYELQTRRLGYRTFRIELHYSGLIGIYISVYIESLVETQNYSMFSLAFIASSFRVTEGCSFRVTEGCSFRVTEGCSFRVTEGCSFRVIEGCSGSLMTVQGH